MDSAMTCKKENEQKEINDFPSARVLKSLTTLDGSVCSE